MQCRQLALILAFGVSVSISWVKRPPILARPPSLGIRAYEVRKHGMLGCNRGYSVRKNDILSLLSSKTGISAVERPSDSLVNPIIFVIVVSLCTKRFHCKGDSYYLRRNHYY